MRVLVVEDSLSLQQSLCLALRKAGYAVDHADDGETGLWLAEGTEYDAIVLDLMIPKIDGLTLLGRLRANGIATPVLILTALSSVDDRVKGLKSGADDYLTKPFAIDELLARVEVLVRRRMGRSSPQIRVGNLLLDSASKSVELNGKRIELKPREYNLLEYLAARPGTVISRTELEEHLYDDNTDIFSNAIDSAICNLRKILAIPNQTVCIKTRKGYGYLIQEER